MYINYVHRLPEIFHLSCARLTRVHADDILRWICAGCRGCPEVCKLTDVPVGPAGTGDGSEGDDYQCRRYVEPIAHTGHRGDIGSDLGKVTELQLLGALTTFDE